MASGDHVGDAAPHGGRLPGARKAATAQRANLGNLNLRVLEPAFQDTEPVAYEELVKRFSLKDTAEGANLLLSAKRIFERHLFEVISEHESGDGMVRAEVEELKRVLVRLAGRR